MNSEKVFKFLNVIFGKFIENISALMMLMSVLLVVRFVYVKFGFDITSLVIAILLLIYSFIIDYSRNNGYKWGD